MIVDKDNMKIDQTGEILDWVDSCLEESQVVTAKVARDSHLNFQDEFVMLHHARYHKETKKLMIS